MKKHVSVAFLGCLFAVFIAAGRANAQEYRWVTGKVAEWTADALTIWVPTPDINITFAVDEASAIYPAGRVVRQLPEQPWKLRQSFPAGAQIEVHYVRQPTRNYAAVVRAPSPNRHVVAGTSMAGVVTAVSEEHITVEADNQQETFAIESSTRVIRERPGRGANVTDLIAASDLVLVFYRRQDNRRAAIEIATLRKHK